MNLIQAKSNVDLIIKSISRGRRGRERLMNMGIREGVIIRKLSQQPFRGPIILKIGNSTVAVGWRMAEFILVEEAGE